MNLHRKGESGNIPYRTGRFFIVDSLWYFSTREGLTHGPFPTRENAAQECHTYIKVCFQVEERLRQFAKPDHSPKSDLI